MGKKPPTRIMRENPDIDQLKRQGRGIARSLSRVVHGSGRACEGRNSELIALLEQYGGWIDAGSTGYARQTEIARKVLAGEIAAHLEPNDFSGRTVAEQLLWECH
jgi:hypothetical protein